MKAALVFMPVLLLKAELQAIDQVAQHRLSSLRQLSTIKVRKRYDCESAHKNVNFGVFFYLEHYLFRHFRTSIKDLTTS